MSLCVLAALTLLGAENPPTPGPEVAECLARVRAIHGGTGPWAVVGYRMGERALRELKLPRQSFAISVVHRSPAEVQYSCVADGLQASTGASAGKLNLRLEEAPADRLRTTILDRKSGRTLTFTVKPGLARSILDVPSDRLEREGERVARLPDGEIFDLVETKVETPARPSSP